MTTGAAPALSPKFADRLKQRILHGYLVRFHMSLIVGTVVASGVLTSRLLLELHVRSLAVRYPLAVLGSYLIFLLLVRIWIWYVWRRQAASFGIDLGNVDLSGSGGGWTSGRSGGGDVPVRFDGGQSGGGGAGSSWEADTNAIAPVSPPRTGWSSFSGLDFDCGDDDWLILLLLALLVLGIVCAGGYLVYAAPSILPDAACQCVLASTFSRVSKERHHGWMTGVLRSTAIPFAIVLLLAGTLGWVAHRHCPQASRLLEVLHCSAKAQE